MPTAARRAARGSESEAWDSALNTTPFEKHWPYEAKPLNKDHATSQLVATRVHMKSLEHGSYGFNQYHRSGVAILEDVMPEVS